VSHESTEQRDIRDYLRPVLKRWWLILAVVPLVTVGTYLYYDHKPKSYGASTELFVQPPTIDRVLLGSGEGVTSEATVENLALLIDTRAVGVQASKELAKAHKRFPSGSVSAVPLEKSNFIVISATAPTPRGAAVLANAYAAAFIATQERQLHGEVAQTLRVARRQLAGLGVGVEDLVKREALEEQIQTLELIGSQTSGGSGIKVIERAYPSPIPVAHDPMSHAIFAFVVSLMLAIGAAFGLEYLTRKINSIESVEEVYELPILSEVPKVDAPAPFDTGGPGMDRLLHEPFHRLQMYLDMLSQERPLRTILIASAAPGEGKSIVTRNLGLAYREAGRNVAVLDADFRKATLGKLLAAEEGPGLTDILAGRASFGQAIQEVTVPKPDLDGNGARTDFVAVPGQMVPRQGSHGDLAVVPAGVQHGDLAAALASGGMRQALSSATDVYDRVLIDSSPLLAAADVLPLLSEVDGVILVTRLGVSTRDSAKRLLNEFKRIPNINVLGVVVNGIPPRIHRTRAYGYYLG
jgi:Mrp family chromosome partitioning ATPase/capsular polysaccharide biosynthesis protein